MYAKGDRARRVDIGTSITGSNGYLLRARPGWDVPVSPAAAMLLSQGLTDRDMHILKACEQLGVLTAEQAGRAFFNDPRSAYTRLRFLESRRFLAKLSVDRSMVYRATSCGYQPAFSPSSPVTVQDRRNPVYILDWNGYYLLTRCYGYAARNWQPATVGVVNARVEHNLGICEAWSYIVAAARATHDLDLVAQDDPSGEALRAKWSHRLQVGLLNERQSSLTQKRAAAIAALARSTAVDAAALYEAGESDFEDSASREAHHALLRPDACFVVGIRGADRNSARASPRLAGFGRTEDRSRSRRWDPTLNSWRLAMLDRVPTAGTMIASERTDGAAYRSLLLELETGTNHQKALTRKVQTYNRLVRYHKHAWETAYGVSPRVLVVVRVDDQVEDQARIWRTCSIQDGETSVLLTSLQTLARAFSDRVGEGNEGSSATDKRRQLIQQSCWLDVMAHKQPTWKRFGEALYLTPVT